MDELSVSQSSQKPSFSSLIAGRAGRKRRIESESELQQAVNNLFIQNRNLSELLLETVSGVGSNTPRCEKNFAGPDETEQNVAPSEGIKVSLLECELRRQAEEMCVSVSLLSARVMIERIQELHGEQDSPLINSVQRSELKKLLHGARELLNAGAFSPKLFWLEYWKTKPVLEVMYQLHAENLLSLQHMLQSDSGVCAWLVCQLQTLCDLTLNEEDGEVRHHIFSTVLCVLVQAGFEDVQDSSFSQSCCSVLDSMLNWLLDSLKETHTSHNTHTAVWLCVYEKSMFDVSVSEDAVHRFFKHSLTHVVTHRPHLKVSDAIIMQSQWNFAKTPSLLTSLFCKVCVLFTMEEVCSHLQQVLETLEVNWQNILSCISTLLIYHPQTQACLKDLLSRLLHSSFQSYDVEKMITGFLLARQGALEGPAVFPSYSDWFKMAFGGPSGYHRNSKKSFVFLLKFLSDLVPFDPPQYLKVHVMYPPYVPGKHRSLLQEFISLSRTRLSDLKVSVEEMGLYEEASGTVAEVKPECVAQQDVDKAVALFKSSGRISATVMEASIFRRPYFLSRFLPTLLTPRVLPETPDAQMAFVEALRKAEKIPAALYSSYTESCLREQQKAGMTDSQELNPWLVIESQLQELKRQLSTGAAEGDLRAQVAVLSQTLTDVCDDSTDKNECDVITLTPELQPPIRSLTTLGSLILQSFCECVIAEAKVTPPNSQWIAVFLKMLLGHKKLYTNILHRVMQLLHFQGSSLSPSHIWALAVLVVEMHVCKDQFPLVEINVSHMCSSQGPPSEVLCQTLPCSTANSMKFSLRFCVAAMCYAVCRSHLNSMELKQFIPSQLYKQLLFLMPRLVPELRAGVMVAAERRREVSSEGGGDDKCASVWANMTEPSRTDWSTLKKLWTFTSVQNLQNQPEHQLSFSEWLIFELSVRRSQDALSDTERQVYEQWVCQQWFLPLCSKAGGCEGNVVTACTHIIGAVLDTWSGTHTHSYS